MLVNIEGASLFFLAAIRASSSLHHAALSSVLKAPLYFFSVNPQGRILNRFASGMLTKDCCWFVFHALTFVDRLYRKRLFCFIVFCCSLLFSYHARKLNTSSFSHTFLTNLYLDMGQIDEMLPTYAFNTLQLCVMCIGSLIFGKNAWSVCP